jgi:hexosaminidase
LGFSLLGLILLPAAIAPAATPQDPDQATLDSFAKNLGYRFTLLSNKATEGCPAQQYCFSASLDLTMPKTMPTGDWSLYLGFAEDVLPLGSDSFALTSVNGSLHRIAPKVCPRDANGGVLFVDGGNVWADSWKVQPSDLRWAAGPGLRYDTPNAKIQPWRSAPLRPAPRRFSRTRWSSNISSGFSPARPSSRAIASSAS